MPLKEVRAALLNRYDGDKQFVGILCAALTHGLEAVVDACAEAVAANTISRDVILNILSSTGEEAAPEQCAAPSHLPSLRMPPVADCHRYDQLLAGGAHAA